MTLKLVMILVLGQTIRSQWERGHCCNYTVRTEGSTSLSVCTAEVKNSNNVINFELRLNNFRGGSFTRPCTCCIQCVYTIILTIGKSVLTSLTSSIYRPALAFFFWLRTESEGMSASMTSGTLAQYGPHWLIIVNYEKSLYPRELGNM